MLEAVADLVPIPAPEVLVDDETRRRIEDLAHRLSHQNATLEEYLQATGQEPQAFIDDVREGAARAVLADLALRAVVAQEAIEVSDDEIDAEVERLAERSNRRSKRYAATSNGGACWRRYALILHAGRRSNSSSITQRWSTRRGT